MNVFTLALRLLLVLSLWLPASAGAAAVDTATRTEIAGLMQALEQSGCRFQRNGTWYAAAQARSHLQRKYDYLLKRDLVTSPERFIALAASRSSMTGRPYKVACDGHAEQDAASWFTAQLQQLRRARD